MEDIKGTIAQLREMMNKQLEGENPETKLSEVGAVVREIVVRLLKRTDLRIATELFFNDLRNNFTRFETFDREYQRKAVEDAMRIIEQLEALVIAEKVVNPDRLVLPEPPASMSRVKSEISRIQSEERDARDRMQRARDVQTDGGGRGGRGKEKPEAGRPELSFSDKRPASGNRRGDRRGGRRRGGGGGSGGSGGGGGDSKPQPAAPQPRGGDGGQKTDGPPRSRRPRRRN
jgi:hypothetical protein